jgi:hypothetical protein
MRTPSLIRVEADEVGLYVCDWVVGCVCGEGFQPGPTCLHLCFACSQAYWHAAGQVEAVTTLFPLCYLACLQPMYMPTACWRWLTKQHTPRPLPATAPPPLPLLHTRAIPPPPPMCASGDVPAAHHPAL